MKSEYASRQEVLNVTGNTTLTRADLGKLITNNGAAGAVTVTLPAGNGDDKYDFFVAAGQTLNIQPQSGDIIVRAANTTAGQKISNATVGSYVTLVCIGANTWALKSTNGTWTAS